MRYSFLILIVVVFSLDLSATTLQKLQDLAVQNREILDKYGQAIEIARQDVAIAKSRKFPRIDITYIVNSLNKDTLLGESRENSVVKGSIYYNIFSGFRDSYNISSAKHIASSKELQAQGVAQDIKMRVALYFTDIYSKKMAIEVSRKNYEAFTQLYIESKKKFEIGVMSRSELLSVRVEQDNAYVELQSTKAELQASINNLNLSVGSSVDLEELDFKFFTSIPQVAHIKKSKKIMLARRADILALKNLISASKAKSSATDSLYYPSFDIVGTYSRYDDSFLNGSGNRPRDDEMRVQIIASYNLYDGRARDAKRAKSRAYESSLRYSLIELENTLKKELQNLYLWYEVSRKNIEATKTGIELAQENLRVTKLSSDEGLITTSELLAAITNLARAQMNNIDAKDRLFKNYFTITRMIEDF